MEVVRQQSRTATGLSSVIGYTEMPGDGTV